MFAVRAKSQRGSAFRDKHARRFLLRNMSSVGGVKARDGARGQQSTVSLRWLAREGAPGRPTQASHPALAVVRRRDADYRRCSMVLSGTLAAVR